VAVLAIMGDDELCGRGIYGVFLELVQQCVKKVGNHINIHILPSHS